MTQWTESRAICYHIERATKAGMYRKTPPFSVAGLIWATFQITFILGVVAFATYVLIS